VVGQYDPVKHVLNVDTDKVTSYLKNGSQMSERVAKLLFAHTKDAVYQKFFSYQTRQLTTKNPDKHA
jgi:ribosomal protein S16